MRRAEAVAVEFQGPGGGTLRGHHFSVGETWAVLVHEEGDDLDAWRGLAAGLTGQGFSVLVFDLPGHLTFSLTDGQRHIERANQVLDRLLIPEQMLSAW